jgi:hypothetical protein
MGRRWGDQASLFYQFRLDERVPAHRTAVSRLFGTKLRVSHSPPIFEVGIPDIGSTESDAGRFQGATAVGCAVPNRCLSIPFKFPR